jgi:thiamine pyrophosphokinase
VNAAYEIIFLRDRSYTILDGKGETISVVPLTSRISLTCTGTAFPAHDLTVKRGETTALRNRITGVRARIEVRGQAFVFHQFSK